MEAPAKVDENSSETIGIIEHYWTGFAWKSFTLSRLLRYTLYRRKSPERSAYERLLTALHSKKFMLELWVRHFQF